ncbi:INT9-like protein [Mya arenaria]|uniref:INT9-like protein n=1 Tax=Mya arenaria TaxID=6604 RepID=A0ABY7EKJ2_MYAAR|nr:INT9-like protein [Mya arenaria]
MGIRPDESTESACKHILLKSARGEGRITPPMSKMTACVSFLPPAAVLNIAGAPRRPRCVCRHDCGLDLTQLLHFLPLPPVPGSKITSLPDWLLATEKFGKNGEELLCMVDLSQVDVILLSNSASMLALPYITLYTGFNGAVYCTDPTLQIGKLQWGCVLHRSYIQISK